MSHTLVPNPSPVFNQELGGGIVKLCDEVVKLVEHRNQPGELIGTCHGGILRHNVEIEGRADSERSLLTERPSRSAG